MDKAGRDGKALKKGCSAAAAVAAVAKALVACYSDASTASFRISLCSSSSVPPPASSVAVEIFFPSEGVLARCARRVPPRTKVFITAVYLSLDRVGQEGTAREQQQQVGWVACGRMHHRLSRMYIFPPSPAPVNSFIHT